MSWVSTGERPVLVMRAWDAAAGKTRPRDRAIAAVSKAAGMSAERLRGIIEKLRDGELLDEEPGDEEPRDKERRTEGLTRALWVAKMRPR